MDDPRGDGTVEILIALGATLLTGIAIGICIGLYLTR